MKGYLAGPMRGYDQFNFPAFDAAAVILRRWGHEVVNPAERDRDAGFDETRNELADFDMRAAIMWDLDAICSSDCVWVLPGWQSSSGCAVELALARFLGIPIFELFDDLSGFQPLCPAEAA
jgi:hypothetical protein